jgi:dihydroflavonol-4-reductase
VIGTGARLLRRDAPVCPEAVRTLLHGHRYDGSRATRELGLRYTPLEVTLLRTLEWFAAQGLVLSARGRRART